MPVKQVMVKQVTEGGRPLGPYEGYYACGEARFNRTGITCYFEGRTFKRFLHPHWSNQATHECLEDGEAYLVRVVADAEKVDRRAYVGKFLRKNRKVEL
jgi:hypothetical protein